MHEGYKEEAEEDFARNSDEFDSLDKFYWMNCYSDTGRKQNATK